MRLTAILIAFSISCGGPAKRDEQRLAPPTTTPTTTSDPLKTRVRELAARLEPCQQDVDAYKTTGAIAVSESCRQAVREVLAGCSTLDLKQLAAHDRITEPCKEALWGLLSDADSHRAVHVLGAKRDARGLELFVTAAGADGEPALDGLRISLEIEGRLEVVQHAMAAPSCDTPLFSASTVMDYSGSMSDRDIDESIELLRTLYAALPDGCLETDLVLFSDVVRRKHDRTTNRDEMSRAVERDNAFPRTTTALVDAALEGTRGVSKRGAPIRLLLVTTDGQENASTRTTAELVAAAQRAGIRVISFGSLLSDVAYLDKLGADTGGFFVYRARARRLGEAAQVVGRLFAATQRLHVADVRLAAATHVVVERGGQRVRLPL